MKPLAWLGLALIASAASGAWRLDGERLLADRQPVFVRGAWYPLDARRDGVALDAAALVRRTRALGLNLLALSVTEGPALEDAAAVLQAAAAAQLAVAVQASGPAAAQRRIVARLSRGPAPALWLHTPEGPVVSSLPGLYQGALGYGGWGELFRLEREAAGRAVLATIEASPPAEVVAQGLLASAAPHPDLYRDARVREATAARYAGDWLLVPEPAQLRLQTYAAIGHGARGVLFDHLGHLVAGPDPRTGVDRALEVEALAEELARLAPWLAGGEPLPALATPSGLAAGGVRRGDEAVVVVWRDRRLDTRTVAGDLSDPCQLVIPGPEIAGLRVLRIDPGGVTDLPADYREAGVRLTVPAFDLTATFLLTPRPPADLVAGVAQGLPAAAVRTYTLALRRWLKVESTLRALEAAGGSAGGRWLLESASATLQQAAVALGYGYRLSALRLAADADRQVRQTQAFELEAALGEPATPEQEPYRTTFPTLPGVYRAPPRAVTGAYQLAPETPVRLDFEALAEGGLPERWVALRGFDQTVATLTGAGDGDGSPRCLRWTPAGAEAGALYLPFTPTAALTGTVRVRASGLARPRLLLLASAAEAPPVAGVALQPEGTVTGWPRPGRTARWSAGWHTLGLRLSADQVTATWDEQPVGEPVAVNTTSGALVLAKLAGDDPGRVDLDNLTLVAR